MKITMLLRKVRDKNYIFFRAYLLFKIIIIKFLIKWSLLAIIINWVISLITQKDFNISQEAQDDIRGNFHGK